MAGPDRWTRGEFSTDGAEHPIFRRGSGAGVIIIVHELPGITPEVVAFTDEVVDAGFTVVELPAHAHPGQRGGERERAHRRPRRTEESPADLDTV